MNCYIFDVHIDCCFFHYNSTYDLLELGPMKIGVLILLPVQI